MSSKTIVTIAGFVGSIIGGYIPVLFGADMLSFSSLICSGIGGIAAILLVVKFL